MVASVRVVHRAKRRAQALLKAAKHAVGIIIEDSETAALARLKQAEDRHGTLAIAPSACNDERRPEEPHDPARDPTSRTIPTPVALPSRGLGKPARVLSSAGGELHPGLDGAGERADRSGATEDATESTQPPGATRELATSAGALICTEVAERLAVNIARCLEALSDEAPEDIAITPGVDLRHPSRNCWPGWVGASSEYTPSKTSTDGAGRIRLVALIFELNLPPVDPATAEPDKAAYFKALCAADAGDLAPLEEIWLERLTGWIPARNRHRRFRMQVPRYLENLIAARDGRIEPINLRSLKGFA
jgi:hypothetical protein